MVKEKVHNNFSWQTGYGAFSVSESAKEPVISYIANQETHHRSRKNTGGSLKSTTYTLMRDTYGISAGSVRGYLHRL